MQSSTSQAAVDASYPPLPESGPPEVSELAQRNFTERERLSKSWRIRIFSKRRPGLTLLEKRSNLHLSDSTSSLSSVSLDAAPKPFTTDATTPVLEGDASRRTESYASDAGRISVKDPDEDDPSKDQHLYRWAMVYENQRGISIFATRRYSSRSLLPRDPPPFSIAAPASSVIDGRPVRKSLQPDISLEDFPLPDGNWHWASKEWMIDMRDETVQHDGFEYNWFFRSKGWRSKAGNLNAGAWVRRRRWLRLMERPPFSALQHEDLVHVAKQPTEHAVIDMNSVWLGDDEDWSRLHRVIHELGRDGRKLEAWKFWIRAAKWSATTELSGSPMSESMIRVLRSHMNELLRSFIYPSSRVEFLQMVTKGGLLSEAEVQGTSKSCPSFVDRTRLEEALSPSARDIV